MKNFNYLLCFIFIVLISGCGGDDEESTDTMYKQEMRSFVQKISSYSKAVDPNFVVIPQNGQELITTDGNEDSEPNYEYLSAIDGVGREDLFYGYDDDNSATPDDEKDYMLAFLIVCEQNGVEVLTTDYCWSHDKMDNSYVQNNQQGFFSFAAPDRELNTIPDYPAQPYEVNENDIHSLADANNFLYLLNPEQYSSKTAYLDALRQTDYDALIIDLYFDDEELNLADVTSLKTKQNGSERLVIAYMSIGEAEDYRYYWQNSWEVGNPQFIQAENPDWEGNYKVKYWDAGWQSVIFGEENAYLDKILAAGFNGVYLDIIDAFEFFE